MYVEFLKTLTPTKISLVFITLLIVLQRQCLTLFFVFVDAWISLWTQICIFSFDCASNLCEKLPSVETQFKDMLPSTHLIFFKKPSLELCPSRICLTIVIVADTERFYFPIRHTCKINPYPSKQKSTFGVLWWECYVSNHDPTHWCGRVTSSKRNLRSIQNVLLELLNDAPIKESKAKSVIKAWLKQFGRHSILFGCWVGICSAWIIGMMFTESRLHNWWLFETDR